MRQRFGPYAAAVLIGALGGWLAPHFGPQVPVAWRPEGVAMTCYLEPDGKIGACLTDAQIAAAATPKPRSTP